jgi:COG1368: phosphoglycerol transferase and related proteins, alkaline phosphatase superfamily
LMNVAGLSAEDEFMKANMAMCKLSNGKLEDSSNPAFVNDYRHYLYQTLKIAK